MPSQLCSLIMFFRCQDLWGERTDEHKASAVVQRNFFLLERINQLKWRGIRGREEIITDMFRRVKRNEQMSPWGFYKVLIFVFMGDLKIEEV